jgi:hypothetical protein
MNLLHKFASTVFEDVLEVSLRQKGLVLLLQGRLFVKDFIQDGPII